MVERKYIKPHADLLGQRFSNLTVREWVTGIWSWRCLCDCGRETLATTSDLRRGRRKSCGCRLQRRGAQSPAWKGGKALASHGYVLVHMPEHPEANNGYVYEHRLVAEQMLGRPLLTGEVVHHKDRNKRHNTPDNLEIHASHAAHLVAHRQICRDRRVPGEDNPLIQCACGCGEWLLKYDAAGRPRRHLFRHQSKGPRSTRKKLP
jgi:HNH endonuclease